MGSYRSIAVPEFHMGQGVGTGTPVRILHLTDLHLHVTSKISRLAALVQRINDLKPDIVVFTGDFLRWGTPLPQADEVARILGLIQAPLGKYAVRGNHDLRGDAEQVPRILQEGGFELVHNRAIRLTLADGTPFWVCGMDDGEFKRN